MTNAPVVTRSLLAIFAGGPRIVSDEKGAPVKTSIYKAPIEGPVTVRTLNIDGDEQSDLTVHGGVDKAVYCYPAEHYPVWRQELNRELEYGAFGENLVVTGLLEADLHVGDKLTIGKVVLQVSQPRFPCYKLALKFEDPGMIRRFQKSYRSGFYCRVLQEGEIAAGQTIELIERAPDEPTIADVVAKVNKDEGL